MRQFVVSEAPASRVAQHVRTTVEDGGGIVAHQTAHKTEFDHLDFTDQSWRRAGYVGTYQRFKEKPVQVRIRVWAQWPRRLLVASVYTGFVVALLFFLASLIEIALPPNLWIWTSLPILAVIAVAFLMYTSSMADSEAVERRIESMLVDRINEDEEITGKIYDLDDWAAYRDTVIDEARQEARERTPREPSRFRQAVAEVGGSLPIGSDDEEASSTGAETEDPPVEPDGEEHELEGSGDGERKDPGRMEALKAKLGFGDDEPDEPGPSESDAASEDDHGSSSGTLAGLRAKLGLGSEDDDGSEPSDGSEDEPEVEGPEDRDEGAEPAAS